MTYFEKYSKQNRRLYSKSVLYNKTTLCIIVYVASPSKRISEDLLRLEKCFILTYKMF